MPLLRLICTNSVGKFSYSPRIWNFEISLVLQKQPMSTQVSAKNSVSIDKKGRLWLLFPLKIGCIVAVDYVSVIMASDLVMVPLKK